jgi:hypothetical protein
VSVPAGLDITGEVGTDITVSVFDPDPVPADLATLRADATYGDGVYVGPAFGVFEFVVLGDSSLAAYDADADAWVVGVVAPADLDTLSADVAYGDGVYTGQLFAPFEYVTLGDGTRVAYDPFAEAWFLGQMVPSIGPDGEVIADLATFKLLIGAKSDADDEQLDDALASASHWVYDRVMIARMTNPDVQLAILLLASRLYKRRQSPEGVAGFGVEGVVVRVLASDPDINRLLERHVDMCRAGIG